jgi:thiol-disulfide isomerase/thioredoxin
VLTAVVVRSDEEFVSEEEVDAQLETDGKGAGHKYPEDSACIILTTENFDETLVTRGPLFVKFYDPHCSHCKQLMPMWEEVAKQVNPKKGEAPIYPMRIGCIDCVANREKCDQMPQMSGFPKFKLMSIDAEHKADIIDYKGERKLEPVLEFAKTVGDIAEQRAKQEGEEGIKKKARREQWKEAEPFFEKAAEESNKHAGIKVITWGNFEKFYNATQGDDAPPNSHLLVVAHGSGYADTKWFDAWEELAHMTDKLQGFNVVIARVDCRNEMPRLCFDHEKFNFPERYDVFPIGMLFNKNFPDGDIDQALHKGRTWQDVAKMLHKPDVVEALEKLASEQQAMMDEL